MTTCGTNCRKPAETAQDPLVKQEHFELAAVCEDVANGIGDRLPGGPPRVTVKPSPRKSSGAANPPAPYRPPTEAPYPFSTVTVT